MTDRYYNYTMDYRKGYRLNAMYLIIWDTNVREISVVQVDSHSIKEREESIKTFNHSSWNVTFSMHLDYDTDSSIYFPFLIRLDISL